MLDDIAFRARLHCGQVTMLPARPHLVLPQAVEVLDAVLEAVLTRRGKDGHHRQGEAQAADPADGVGELMGSLETGVIVELCVVRQAERTPTLQKIINDFGRAEGRAGPSIDLVSVQCHAGEDVNQRPACDLEVLDDIEAIELGTAGSHLRQIPARWGWWSTDAVGTVGDPMAFKDAIEGGPRGADLSDVTQRPPDRFGTVLSKHAVLAQSRPQSQDAPLKHGGSAPWRMLWARRSSREVDTVQTLARGPLDPECHLSGTDTEALRDRAHAQTLTNGFYHCPTPLLN